jgi:hypothetical protein
MFQGVAVARLATDPISPTALCANDGLLASFGESVAIATMDWAIRATATIHLVRHHQNWPRTFLA